MRWCVFLLGAAALYGQVAEGNIVDGISGAPVAWAYVSSRRRQVRPHPPRGATWGAISEFPSPRRISNARGSRYPDPIPGAFPAIAGALESGVVGAADHVDTAGGDRGTNRGRDGYPVQFVFVQAVNHRKLGDRTVIAGSGSPAFQGLGEYRISGLPAGSYYIRIFVRRRTGTVGPSLLSRVLWRNHDHAGSECSRGQSRRSAERNRFPPETPPGRQDHRSSDCACVLGEAGGGRRSI